MLLLIIWPVAVAKQKPRFEHLTVKQGLSQSGVTCIVQDRQGFLWLGTQDGLNRFDGYNCRVFRHDPSDSMGLSENFIVSLSADSSGIIWAGTLHEPQNYFRFHPESESFQKRARSELDPRRAIVGATFSTFTDGRGVNWSGSIGGGVKKFDPASGKTTLFRHDPRNPASLIDDKVYSVYGDRSGTIWVGTREGLDRFDPKTASFIHYRHDARDAKSLSNNWVWPILEDRSGNLWVGTFGGGLNMLDRTNGTFTRYRHDERDPTSLSDDAMYSLFQDRSGMIWVGTADHGADRFVPDMKGFTHLQHDPADPGSLIDNSVNAIVGMRGNVIWIGTNGGLDRYDAKAGRIQHYRQRPGDPSSLGDNKIASMSGGTDGALWIGFFSAGLDRWDPRTNSFVHFRRSPIDRNSLSDDRVYATLTDRDGSLWVGTYSGGLNRFDPRTQTWNVFVHRDSVTASLGADGVWALCLDHAGDLWIGTYGGGLDRFDRSTQSFVHHRHAENDPYSLSDNTIVCLFEDHTHSLWVGTTNGLNKVDRTTGRFEQFHIKDGLPNSVILGILEDKEGLLWISTNKGLSRFDRANRKFRNFSASDGLQGDEFNQNAYGMDPTSGELYFGGSNGITVFRPEEIQDNPFVPPIVFSGFRRYSTDDAEGRPIEERGIAAKPEVRLSYKDNVATFEFSALNYLDPSKNRYAYLLEGYSGNWIHLGTERQATFTNLDKGEYVLRVRGSNNDGVWNEQGASLRIIVTPPWWKTQWAYGGYAMLAVGFLYGMRRFELNRREQKTRVRESELRTKAAEAEKRVLEVENERKSRELEDARQLQLSLLPREVPEYPGYQISVFMRTATEVGGDYYDFLPGQDGTLNVVIGDATGHGMQAGTIVTLMKGLFLADSSRLDIRTFLDHSSKAIKDIRLGRLFMACTFVRLSGTAVAFSCAGMPPVFIFRANERCVEEINPKGMPLGAMKHFPYDVQEVILNPGDAMLLLSDGMPEQRNAGEEMFGYERIQQLFMEGAPETAAVAIARLTRAAEQWTAGAPPDDDITLMVIKRIA